MATTEPLEPPEYDDPIQRVRAIAKLFQENVGLQFHTGILAVQIRDHIRDTDPVLLAEWDAVMELEMLKSILAHLRNMQRRRSSPFKGTSAFDVMLEVDAGHTQRRSGDLVKHEIDYVIRQYRKRIRTMTQRVKKLVALMQRMENETVTLREVATEEEVADIFLEVE